MIKTKLFQIIRAAPTDTLHIIIDQLSRCINVIDGFRVARFFQAAAIRNVQRPPWLGQANSPARAPEAKESWIQGR